MNPEFVLIGDPVAHSLSPIMHNMLYRELGEMKWPFSKWTYRAIQCKDRESATYQINLVRTGRYRGMNVTMPWKALAFECADFVEPAVMAAGGANVLVRDEDFKLCAFNTDGKGAIGAIERSAGITFVESEVMVCGTGPTSLAIATAAAQAGARSVYIFSRDEMKALSSVNRIRSTLDANEANSLHGRDYSNASNIVSNVDIIVDATPCGMKEGDEAIIDTSLLHPGQVVMDTVYAHGTTALLAGAEEHGAVALDGLEMLVEQAALSVEIWADAMALPVEIDRAIMRRAALLGQTATE